MIFHHNARTHFSSVSCASSTRGAKFFSMSTAAIPSGPGVSIRALRTLAGLTLDQVAHEAGVSAAHLSRVETGQVAATPRWLGVVAGVIADHLSRVA